MEKIYGYKEKDVVGLAKFISSNKTQTLTSAFNEYAKLSGKAQGTIRNLYYALARKSNSDNEFCKKYLDGSPLSVNKIASFSTDEEEILVKNILREKLSGRSARSVILELAKGDQKRALRYQNKYRNFIKNNPEKVEQFALEIAPERQELINGKDLIIKEQIKKLKSQINGLVEKISLGVRKENEKLKTKNAFLERENAQLKRQLSLLGDNSDALSYFLKKNGNQVFN